MILPHRVFNQLAFITKRPPVSLHLEITSPTSNKLFPEEEEKTAVPLSHVAA